MGEPTRFIGGVSFLENRGPLKDLPLAANPSILVDYNHFTNFVAGDWTITETDAGATEALIDAQGGILRVTNSAADNDQVGMQKVGESWKLVANKKTWFEARIRCSEATQVDWFVGLVITDTSVVAGFTDGIGFRKDDGDTQIDFTSLKNSAGSTQLNLATFAANTFVRLGFYFDGKNVFGYVDGVQKFTIPQSSLVFCDDEELALTFVVQNGDGNARTFDIDYYVVAQELGFTV